jgi:hypothetical protein
VSSNFKFEHDGHAVTELVGGGPELVGGLVGGPELVGGGLVVGGHEK